MIGITLFDALVDPYLLRAITEVVVLGRVASEVHILVGRTNGQLFGLQTREGLLDHRLCGLGIEVTDHIVRHVPSVVELDQLGQTRVLQVLRKTDHITLVRATFVDIRKQLVRHL